MQWENVQQPREVKHQYKIRKHKRQTLF